MTGTKQWRERPPLESIRLKTPGIFMCGCGQELRTFKDLTVHYEAGHFDTNKCECGFTWGPFSGSHGHFDGPSLAPLPISPEPIKMPASDPKPAPSVRHPRVMVGDPVWCTRVTGLGPDGRAVSGRRWAAIVVKVHEGIPFTNPTNGLEGFLGKVDLVMVDGGAGGAVRWIRDVVEKNDFDLGSKDEYFEESE